ncbi:MAG TPA: glycosyl hydrolase family 18 protein [Hanamia sp.]|nr:glycosyl hydrolase family 18 protein [Hanamia sp.]
MKLKPLFFTLLLLIISVLSFSQKKNKPDNKAFKIVGYYFLNTALRDTVHADSSYLFLNKITHLNIAFINPDSSGNFRQNLAIDTLIKKAHQKKVKVLASIAGGGSHVYYHMLLRDNNQKLFVQNIVSLVKRYDLDGIDVDLEGTDIDSNYQSFVIELAKALKADKKIITAAIATAYKDELPDKALKQFDFINIMSYDQTGPWQPANPGDHSPYIMAEQDLDYWHNVRSIPKEKLVLGVPFYGYGFGSIDSPVVSMSYKQIVSLYPNRLLSDTLLLANNITMYFNNVATIQKKTRLALQKAGGVMIWQLLGDAEGDLSLLNAIKEVVENRKHSKQK